MNKEISLRIKVNSWKFIQTKQKFDQNSLLKTL